MAEDMTITTAGGRLRGRIENGVAAFKGIPYGECGGGQHRCERARRVAPWDDVRDAFHYGPRAIQPESREMKVTSDQIEDLMARGAPDDDQWRQQSENCLPLNIWTPAPTEARKRPVLFLCHGGKYFGETPHVWWFGGENLAAREDVVVVTVRYRVGVLGFLDISGLPGGANHKVTANVGMLDLVDALEWVRDNIAAFGGDPANVTIFGESGGGLKVSVLMAMPAAKGLFHKAIVQSGTQLEEQTREDAALNALALMNELGLEAHEVESLFDFEPARLVEAEARLAPSFASHPTGRRVEFEPVIDGDVLPEGRLDHCASGTGRHVPLLIGTCATETTFFMSVLPNWQEVSEGQVRGMTSGTIGPGAERIISLNRANRPEAKPIDLLVAVTSDFILRRKAIRMAEERAQHASASTHMYVLAFETDVHDGVYHTPHILDLPLVFAHADHPILGSNPARRDVSRQMSGAWAAFARTGHPASTLLPEWMAHNAETRATMVFTQRPYLASDPRGDERAIWVTPVDPQAEDERVAD